MVAPILEKLSQEFSGSLKVVKVNVDESPRIAQKYNARSIPMLLFMRDGELVDTDIGAQPEHVLRSQIEAQLAGPTDDTGRGTSAAEAVRLRSSRAHPVLGRRIGAACASESTDLTSSSSPTSTRS